MGGLNKNRWKNKNNFISTPTIQGTYTPPPRNTCEETPIAYLVTDNPLIRLIGRTWRQGRLVDFIINIEVRRTEKSPWVTAVSIDCCHGKAHVHHYKNGEKDGETPEVLKILDSVADVKDALKLAVAYARKEQNRLESKIGKGGENSATI